MASASRSALLHCFKVGATCLVVSTRLHWLKGPHRHHVNLSSYIWIAFAQRHEGFYHLVAPRRLYLRIGNRLHPVATKNLNFQASLKKSIAKRFGIKYTAMAMVNVHVVKRILLS